MTNFAKLLIACCLIHPMLACNQRGDRAAEAKVEHYTTRGRVMQISQGSLELIHETIPNMRGLDGKVRPMEPMTMPFATPEALRPPGLAVGDAVQFTFDVHYEAEPTLRVTAIEKLPQGVSLQIP